MEMMLVYLVLFIAPLIMGVCLGSLLEWRNAKSIREDALREAAYALSELADNALTALAYEHAHACRDEILDLIGEKK